MIQEFDHRSASAVVNPENLKRPSQSRTTNTRRTQGSRLVT